MGESGGSQSGRHCRLTGGNAAAGDALVHATASGPQAAVWASRVASASEAAEAVAVFRAFLSDRGGALGALGGEGRPEQETGEGQHGEQCQEPASLGHSFLRTGWQPVRNPYRARCSA